MRRNKAKDRGLADTSRSVQPDASGTASEIVPWAGGTLPDRTTAGQPAQLPSSGQPSGPKVVQVRRSILLWLVCMVVVAALVIAGLVRYLPARTASAVAATATATATSSAASRAQPSTSATQPSPADSVSATGTSSGGASPAATSSASPGATTAAGAVAAGGGGAGAPLADLTALTPVSQSYIAGLSTGPQQIGATTYEDSVRLTCESVPSGDVVYDVAGYKFLTTVIGIPSDASNAAGNAMTITFYKDGSANQLSSPVTVSLDHPQSVHLNLQGSSQLEVSCSAINTTTQATEYMDVALGNATIGPS
jgi:hypothetical protein